MARSHAFGRTLAVLAALLVCSEHSLADDYYVRVSGNDANSGAAPGSAWATINKAMQTVSAGDTVYVGAGTYTEHVSVLVSGSSGNPVRVIADTSGSHTGDAGEVVISGGDDAFESSGKSNVHLEGFTVRSTGSSAVRIGDGTGWVIRRCVLEGGTNYTFYFRNNGSVTLEDVTIRGATGGGGLYADNATVYADGLTIENVDGWGVNLQNSGSTFYGHRVRILGTTGAGLRAVNGDFLLVDSLIANCGDSAIHAQNGGVSGTLLNSTVYGCLRGVYMLGGSFTSRGVIWANNSGTALDARNSSYCHDFGGLMDGNGSDTNGNAARTDPITGDPAFVDAAGGDFHPGVGSAAIDAGYDASGVYAAYGWSATDLDGVERGAGAGYDAGAYEGAGLTYAAIPYSEDFEGPVGGEWSSDETVFGSGGVGTFLGSFGQTDAGNESVSLSLSTTPGQDYRLTFDLAVMEDWDGAGEWQDNFTVTAGGVTLFDESFENTSGSSMTYPYPPDVSGTNFAAGSVKDALYRGVEVGFTATGSKTTLVFTGVMTGAKDLESWGLDNVRVVEQTIVAADVPYYHGFESTPGYEWDTRTTDATDSDYGGMLGRTGGTDKRSVYINTTPGETYWLYFDLYALDNWAGQTFEVSIDQDEVVSAHLTAGGWTKLGAVYPESTGDLGFGPSGDLVYRLVRVPFTASSPETRITFAASIGADLDATPDTPSWGLDNVIVTDVNALPGLNAVWTSLSSYVGNLTAVDFSSPDHTSVELDIDWPSTSTEPMYEGGPAHQFAVLLSGYLDVPEDGVWQFRLTSDDGAKMRLGGAEVIDNDGQHSARSRTCSVELAEGLTTVEVRFFEWQGISELRLEWRGPSDTAWATIPPTAYYRPTPRFVDVTTPASFGHDFGDGGGWVVVDFDNDGDLDVLGTGEHAALLFNDGSGAFTARSDFGTIGGPACPVDIDADGDQDIVAGAGTSVRFYENTGGGSFVDRGGLGLTSPLQAQGLVPADVSRDGLDDLVVFSPHSNFVAINRGEDFDGNSPVGFETDETDRGFDGIGQMGSGSFASAGDVNNDGIPDLYYLLGGGRLFASDGAWAWAYDQGQMSVQTPSGEGFGAAWGDFDNDGDTDAFVPAPTDGTQASLFRNTDASFADVAATIGAVSSGPDRSAAWGDFDNDGDLDLAVAVDGESTVALYEQLAGGVFAWYLLGVSVEGPTTDVQWADIDNDGDLDLLLMGDNRASTLLQNLTDDDRYLEVRLVGANGSGRRRSVSGARVELWDAAGQLVATRELNVPRGHGGWGDVRAHFGGVNPSSAYQVRVRLAGDEAYAAFDLVPATTTSAVGRTILAQTLTVQAWQIQSRVRVTRWRETGVTD